MRRRSVLAVAGAIAAVGLAPGAIAAEPLFLGAIRWDEHDRRFGGLSAIDIAPNGRDVLLVSDRGILIEAQLGRDAHDRIATLRATAYHHLLGPNGTRLPRERADAEGIAVAPDGTIFIAFEGARGGRIRAYSRPGAVPVDLPRHPAHYNLGSNAGLEALAIRRDGTLFAIPEDVPGPDFPVFAFRGGRWHDAGGIARRGRFLPVGADFGPDGRLYLLERGFSLPVRFASRIRRFDSPRWGEGEVVLETRSGRHDNLEGLSVRREASGRIRATMVSDDNFRFFQRTEIVEYLLPA